MLISRRTFLEFCLNSVGTLGVTGFHLAGVRQAVANPSGPMILWLQGACCSGCSVSFLDYISSASPPRDAADVLVADVNLAYHPSLMGAAGQLAYDAVQRALALGGYILAVEGGVPTAFNGSACDAWWDPAGRAVTFKDALVSLSSSASQILCIGTCASWGGVPATGPNPAGIRSVAAITGKPTIHLAGCPAHPNWIVWGIVNAIAGTVGALDTSRRPTALYPAGMLHLTCEREVSTKGTTYGLDGLCLRLLGCRGPTTLSKPPCTTVKWNGVNWCMDCNTPCLGCVEPGFPGTAALRKPTTPMTTIAKPIIRLNAGGGNATDAQGKTWYADKDFRPSAGTASFTTTRTIAGANNQLLYQSQRRGAANIPVYYSFGVPNGNYNLLLKFAEIDTLVTAPGQRVFDVVVNGVTVLAGLDIVAATGNPFTALDRTIPVSVSEGKISLSLVPNPGTPVISAAEIA